MFYYTFDADPLVCKILDCISRILKFYDCYSYLVYIHVSNFFCFVIVLMRSSDEDEINRIKKKEEKIVEERREKNNNLKFSQEYKSLL